MGARPKTPRRAFTAQKGSAKQRGIAFDLTFDEWWALWEPHFHNRGRGPGQLMMLRFRDEGGYSVGNVRIGTRKENAAEGGVVRRVKRSTVFCARTSFTDFGGLTDWMHNQGKMGPYEEEDEDGY